MGKKQDKINQANFDRMMRMMESQINQATQPTWYDKANEAEYGKIQGFLDSRDYRNLPTGVNVDLMGQAENNKMREMMLGRDTGGQAAAGTMGRIGATQNKLLADQSARDWSGSYEQKIGELQGRKDSLGGIWSANNTQRNQMGISGYGNMMGLIGQRPKDKPGFWSQFAQGALQGGLGILGAFV